MPEPLEAADAIDQIERADRAAALELAEDFPFTESTEEAEAEATADDPDPEPAKPKAPAAKEEPAGDPKPKRLADLAAEKRRERMEAEASRAREQRQRDVDRERDDLERERRAFQAERERLKADPFGYAEKELGLDRSAAAERLVASTLRPEEAKLREMVEQQAAELRTFREKYETEAKTKVQRDEEARWQAHQEATYSSWDNVSGDREKYPLTSRLPPMVRRQYGDYIANLLADAHPGRRFSQEEIAIEVENDLRADEPVGEPGSGTRDETAGANGAGKKRPPDTLTNDLASETAGTLRDLLDPSTLRKNAMRAAAKLKW
jgi:hypothetical protein